MPFLFALVRPLTQPTRVGRQALVLVPSPHLKLTSFYVRISGWNQRSTDAAIESRLRARKYAEHSIAERSGWTSSLRVFRSCMWAYVGVDVKEKFRSAIPADFFSAVGILETHIQLSFSLLVNEEHLRSGDVNENGMSHHFSGEEKTLNLKFSLDHITLIWPKSKPANTCSNMFISGVVRRWFSLYFCVWSWGKGRCLGVFHKVQVLFWMGTRAAWSIKI